jgi:methionyl aminopeptidase
MIFLKTLSQISDLAKSGKILAETLENLQKFVGEGVSLMAIENKARKLISDSGGEPAFLGFNGYEFASCISINDEVVHGIPSDYILKKNDLVSIDLGVRYNGMCTDSAITVFVGSPNAEIKNLLAGTKSALYKGIAKARVGNYIGDIEHAIGSELRAHNLFPVMSLSGHGIGKSVHEDPSIMCDGVRGTKDRLRKGMVLAIEPMATTAITGLSLSENGWSHKSKNGCLSAHFEHTVAITKTGPKILTEQSEDGSIVSVKNE